MKYPAISIIDGGIEVWRDLDKEINCTLLSYLSRSLEGLLLYDSDGRVFRTANAVPQRRIRPIEKLFVHICWNPGIRVKLTVEDTGKEIATDKLRAKIRHAIRNDDDVYCQFMEKKEIYELLDGCSGVSEMIARLIENRIIE